MSTKTQVHNFADKQSKLVAAPQHEIAYEDLRRPAWPFKSRVRSKYHRLPERDSGARGDTSKTQSSLQIMNTWTLVFDLDGTLVDTAPDLAAATNHVMLQLGLQPVAEGDIRPFVGYGALAMVEGAAAAQGRNLGQQELYDLFELFIAHYTANISAHSKPYETVVSVLQRYQDNGARLAVCTNKLESHARALLEALNMAKYFSAITGRDTFPVFKPNPDHLTGTIALAGGHARRTIMVGDTETDIRTAKAAGVPVVAVDFGYSVQPVATFAPDAVISHYRDFERVAGLMMTSRI
jgi:phosphoglycolate phosphatase